METIYLNRDNPEQVKINPLEWQRKGYNIRLRGMVQKFPHNTKLLLMESFGGYIAKFIQTLEPALLC